MNRSTRLTLLASILTACGAAGSIAGAQSYSPQPIAIQQPGEPQPLPLLAPDQLDQLVGPIALYPDPMVAQILPAATYPIDVVKAARLVRSGASPDQIDQQPWDPSVKAVAHETSVIEMMDQSIDWTQQLGQAFIAQPDDVMQSIQRLRLQAQNVGNLVTTPQQQVYVEDSYVRIVPADPNIIYVPTYDPTVVYYTPPVYGSYVSFGYGFPCGSWFDLDLDWHNHWAYRPGWTWNHWHDNFFIEHNTIRPRHDFEPHRGGGDRPVTVWHRDDSRPLTFSGRRTSRPSDFDNFRGRNDNRDTRRTPDTIHNPVGIDRGRAPETRTNAPIYQQPRNTGNPRGDDNRREPATSPNAKFMPQPRPSEPVHAAPAPATNPNAKFMPQPRAPEPAPVRVSRPAEPAHAAPAPAVNPNAKFMPQPRATEPAHVSTPPVHIAPPPAARPATPAYVQPAHQDNRGGGSKGGDDGKSNDGRGHK